MDARQAFRAGFLAQCAETGLDMTGTEKAAEAALEKLAQMPAVSLPLGAAVTAGTGVLRDAAGWAIPLALAAPWGVGALGGYGLARARDVDDTDVAEIKDREVLDEYGRQTERLKRKRAVKDYLAARQRAGSRIF